MQIECPICELRMKFKKKLDRIGKREGKFAREKLRTNLLDMNGNIIQEGFVEKLIKKEICPNCGSRGFATIGANFRQNRHFHRCGKCGWESEVYNGEGIDPMLE